MTALKITNMKRIEITPELRQRIYKKFEEVYKIHSTSESFMHYGGGTRELDLLRTYMTAGTIREDIYEELCGII